MTEIRVYLLDSFDQDEVGQIIAYLIGDTEDATINVTNCDEGDIVSAFVNSSDVTMIFIDRVAFEAQQYIIADGKVMTTEWYLRVVLENYGIEYTENWQDNQQAVEILKNAAVPYVYFSAESTSIIEVWTQVFEEDGTLETFASTDDVQYSYTDDADAITEQLNELNVDEDNAEEGGEEDAAEEEGGEEDGGEEEGTEEQEGEDGAEDEGGEEEGGEEEGGEEEQAEEEPEEEEPAEEEQAEEEPAEEEGGDEGGEGGGEEGGEAEEE